MAILGPQLGPHLGGIETIWTPFWTPPRPHILVPDGRGYPGMLRWGDGDGDMGSWGYPQMETPEIRG